MTKLFIKKFLCLCGLALALTGCYREEIDALKSEVDALRINDLETMVSNMGSSVKELQNLKDVLDPAVKDLQEQKENILKEISSMQGKMGEDEKASTEMQAQLLSLQSQLSSIEAALEAINKANLSSRIDELKAFVNSANSDLKGRIDVLDAAQQTFATAAALAELQAAVERLQNNFDAEFLASLNRNADEIKKWISDQSNTIIALFGDYYKKEEIDAKLEILKATDTADDDEIKAIKKRVNDLDSELRKIIDDAISGVEKRLAERIGSAEQKLESLVVDTDGLEKRIDALEKLYSVIGDFSDYKSNLIADIRALEEAIGTDGTLTTLVNTLKLILTDSEGKYYDLAAIVSNVAANTSSAADHDKRIASLEGLVSSFAKVEAVTGLEENIKDLGKLVEELQGKVNGNSDAVATLTKRVDEIVGKWSDAVFSQIQNNADEISDLKQKAINLQAAIDKAVSDGQEADKKEHEEVIGLITKIDESIAALVLREELAEQGITDINEAIQKINNLLEGCNVGEVKGLQACLTNLDSRIKDLDSEINRIWAVIGSEELAIQGSLINAINIINAKFGDLGGKTVKEILDALEADIILINACIDDEIKGNDPQGQSLTSLKALIDELTAKADGKADSSTVKGLADKVGDIQEELKVFIETYNKNLGDYLLKADAEGTYATIAAVQQYIDSYTALVGTLTTNVNTILGQVSDLNIQLSNDEGTIGGYNTSIGTIEGEIVTINGKIGTGSFTGNWTTDLIAAVNKLHELVGDETVEKQAADIAQEKARTIAATMINALVKDILGSDGTGEDIKDKLDGFTSSIGTLETSIATLDAKIGDISDLKDAKNPDIAAMIRNIKSELAGLAAKQHTHEKADITGLIDSLDTISNNLDTVSDKLDTLDTYVRETLENRINELNAKFADYTTPAAVSELIAAAENILVAAILSGNSSNATLNGYFAQLNLNEFDARIKAILNTDIANIIKDDGTIDTKAKKLVDAAIAALDITQYLTKTGFNEEIAKYAKMEDVDSSIAIATAIAALQVEFETGNVFTYGEFDDAVEYLYSLLKDHIDDYTAAQTAFNAVKETVDAIAPMIGEGFSKDRTIASVIFGILGDITEINTAISGINELFGSLGNGNTVESLIGGLQDLYDSLINALLGVTQDGDPSDITGEYSLPTLKGRIDALEDALGAIGFEDIKTTIDGKEFSLGDIIGGINGQISKLSDTIGKGYDENNTVAKALGAFQTALDDYVKGSVYEDTVGGIEKDLQELIDSLTGSNPGEGIPGNVVNLSNLSSTLTDLIRRLDDFNETTSKDIESFFDELKDRLDTIEGIVGTLPDDKDWTNLASVIEEMYDYIFSAEFSGKIYDNAAEALRGKMGVTELLNMIGNMNSLNIGIKDRGSLVAAINSIYSLISSGNYVTDDDLTKLKLEILFGGGSGSDGDLQTLKALEEVLNGLRNDIGNRPADETIFEAIARLEQTIAQTLGSNPGSDSIWDAIAELKAMMNTGSENKTLSDFLHSMSFISDFADGYATIPCDRNRSNIGDLVMKFNVVATPDFKTNLDNEKYSVSALIREVRTRAADDKAVAASSAVLEGGILSVTVPVSKSDVSGYVVIAVAIEEKEGSDKFVSPYVPIAFSDTYIDFLYRMPTGVTRNNSTLTISPLGGTFSVFDTNAYLLDVQGNGQFWVSVDERTLEIKVEENETNKDNEQEFTVTAADGSNVSLSFTIVQPCKKIVATYGGNTGDSFNVPASYTSYVQIGLSNTYSYNGGYKIGAEVEGNFRTAPIINGNTVYFRTARGDSWQGGKFTVSTNDDKCSLTITLTTN